MTPERDRNIKIHKKKRDTTEIYVEDRELRRPEGAMNAMMYNTISQQLI